MERAEARELSLKAVQTLTRMRELLQRGWIQGRAYDGWSGVCIQGALTRSFYGWKSTSEVVKILCQAMNMPLDWVEGKDPLAVWNDAPGRTQAEVLRLLDGILARGRK